MNVRAVYVHIPFCLRKCRYCDFSSYPGMEDLFGRYTDAIRSEIRRMAEQHPSERVSTIFFGGGTPNLLPPDLLSSILDEVTRGFPVDADAEISVEANPGAAGSSFADLRAMGFNRLSLGVQSFQDEELRLLGRIHDSGEAVSAFHDAREAGFGNLSIDLMYGIPEQTPGSWRDTLRQSASLSPEHISLYSLTVEEGTPFFGMRQRGMLPLPDDDIEAEMYSEAIRTLTSEGYTHYEISNFAKPGFQCRHNITYWHNEPYFGFGAGATSYVAGRRASNLCGVQSYIEAIENGRDAVESEERLTGRASMGETVFLGLRMLDGLDVRAFHERYGVSVEETFGPGLRDLRLRGLMTCSTDRIRLTERGLFLADPVFAEFVI